MELGLRKPNNKNQNRIGFKEAQFVLGFLAHSLFPYKYIMMYWFLGVNAKFVFQRERERQFFSASTGLP